MASVLFTDTFLLDMLIFLLIALGIVAAIQVIWRAIAAIGKRVLYAGLTNTTEKIIQKVSNMNNSVERFQIPVAVVNTVLCLISVGIFLYYVVQVTKITDKAGSDGYSEATLDAVFSNKPLLWIEFAISIWFMLELVHHYLNSVSKISFITNHYVWIDLATSIPGLIGPFTHYYFYGLLFLRMARMAKSVGFFLDLSGNFLSDVSQTLIKLSMTLLALVFSAASFIFVLENSTVTTGGKVNDLMDAFYFAFVTLSTVGYGDITPITASGKVAVIIIIIATIGIIPSAAGKLAETITASRSLSFARFIGKNHVVLVSHNDKPVLPFLKEFYHKERKQNATKVCLLLKEESISRELRIFSHKPNMVSKLTILSGHPLVEGDLARANAKKAQAVFMFGSGNLNNDVDDAETILSTSAIRQYKDKIPVMVQIHNSLYKAALQDHNVDVILNMNDIRMSVLAQSTICRGFATIITNVVQSFELPKQYETLAPWEQQYIWGAGHEIYAVKSLDQFIGMQFALVVETIYADHGALLVGISYIEKGEHKHVFNPGSDFLIRSDHQGILLAQDGTVAKDVAVYFPVSNITPRARSEDYEQECKLLEKYYLYDFSKKPEKLPRYRNVKESIIQDVEELTLDKYIVVTGDNFDEISSYVKKLREFNLKEMIPVIILSPKTPNGDKWLDSLGRIPQVYFVRGDPTSVEDLTRAGAFKAMSAIVLSQGVVDANDLSSDAKPIMTFQQLRKGEGFPMIDLIHSSNSKFLGTNARHTVAQNVPSELEQPTYSGHVFTSASLNTLLAQSYFNRDVVNFLGDFVNGITFSIPISVVFPYLVGKEYHLLLSVLLRDHHLVSIGLCRARADENVSIEHSRKLFRLRNKKDSSLPRNFVRYVVMNPVRDLLLDESDEVIVIVCQDQTKTRERVEALDESDHAERPSRLSMESIEPLNTPRMGRRIEFQEKEIEMKTFH